MTNDKSFFEFWHYTNWSGFQGIVQDKAIRLSDPRYTNDMEELQYSKRLAQETVQASSLASIASEFVLNNWDAHVPLIACFSEDGDQLGQWRGYGDNGRGYAIGFLSHSVSKIPDPPGEMERRDEHRLSIAGPVFGRVRYKPDEQRALLQEACRPYVGATSIDKGQLQDLAGRLHMTSAFVKHPGFEEERERRLVGASLYLDGAAPRTLIEPTVGVSVLGTRRYGTYPIAPTNEEPSDPTEEGYKLKIIRIRLGPANDSDSDDVKHFVHRAGHTDADVVRSSIPYLPRASSGL